MNFNGYRLTAGDNDTYTIGGAYDFSNEENGIYIHYGKKLFGTPRLDLKIYHN
jgi:hypothetical protein